MNNHRSSNSIWGYLSKRIEIKVCKRQVCTPVLITVQLPWPRWRNNWNPPRKSLGFKLRRGKLEICLIWSIFSYILNGLKSPSLLKNNISSFWQVHLNIHPNQTKLCPKMKYDPWPRGACLTLLPWDSLLLALTLSRKLALEAPTVKLKAAVGYSAPNSSLSVN